MPSWKSIAILIGIIVWACAVAWGLLTMKTNIDDIFPWLPDNTTDRADYEWFVQHFGSDDLLIVSWDGCVLDDPRIPKFVEFLRNDKSVWLGRVISAPEVLEELVQNGAGLSRREAIERLKGFQVGPDGNATCLLIYLSPAGMRDRHASVQYIIDSAQRSCGLTREDLHLGGPPYLGFYSSQITLKSMVGFSIPIALLSTLFVFVSFRSKTFSLVTMCSAGVATVTAIAIVPLAGYRVNGLLTALPSLIYIVTTSGTIHVVNYSHDLLQSSQPDKWTDPRSFRSAIRSVALRPCLLSSVSTALGTFSLTWSKFPAIREFGYFATLGIAIAFLVHLLILPELLALRWVRLRSLTIRPMCGPQLARLFQLVVSHRPLIITSTLLLTMLLAFPLGRLKGQFSISKLFTSDSEFIRNVRWLEQHLGPIDATEIVISLSPSNPSRLFTRLQHIQRLEQRLADLDHVEASFSAAKVLPSQGMARPVFLQILARVALEKRRADMLGGPYLVDDGTSEHWRITLRTSIFMETERTRLRREIEQTIAQELQDWKPQATVRVTGASQLFLEAKDDVLHDFTNSLLLAYGLILGLMVLALQSWTGGLLAMLPNALPNLIAFGVLSWLDGAIDIGMTVAACIALGIAVDDTSHLLMSFRRARTVLPNRFDALKRAFGQCSSAMCQTSLICGLSMVPFLFSELIYLSRFGLLLPTLMGAALIGDLLLLPAIMASPAGRFFERSLPSEGAEQQPSEQT